MDSDVLREPRLILCEGQGEAAFFRHLVQDRGLPSFDIDYPKPGEPGGKDAFDKRLDALRTKRGFENLSAIIVVSDNDDDPAGSFNNVRRQIEWARYGVPNRPLEVARAETNPAIVVLMLPWAYEPGNLETLCLKAAYDQWPDLKPCLDEYAACARTNDWEISKQSKMRLRCLLSAVCRVDPNTSLVYAWSGNGRGTLIPLNHRCFNQVSDFLRDFGTRSSG